jgi:hypothetical protein
MECLLPKLDELAEDLIPLLIGQMGQRGRTAGPAGLLGDVQ